MGIFRCKAKHDLYVEMTSRLNTHCIIKVFTPDDSELVDTYQGLAGGFPKVLSDDIEKALIPHLGEHGLVPSTLYFFERYLNTDLISHSWRTAEALHALLCGTEGMFKIHLNNLLKAGLVIKRKRHSNNGGYYEYSISYLGIEKLTGYQIIIKENK